MAADAVLRNPSPTAPPCYRSKMRSSTFRRDRGNRTYIITTKRMTSGELLKYWNGLLTAHIDMSHGALTVEMGGRALPTPLQ
jgi:hypothetical protein